MQRIHLIALTVLMLSLPIPALAQSSTPAAEPATMDDYAGLVDIGGRSLYLECRGEGSPTVVLVSGYRASGRFWSDDLLQPDAPRTMVLPGVAQTTRVCAYDRPGTVASIDEDDFVSRSDPITQPRTSMEIVAELHALLQAAEIPGPYVLAGHSMGGFFSRLYASTYPDEVVGLVLVDAYSEQTETLMTPEQWEAMGQLSRELGSDTVVPIPGYGDLETIGFGADNATMRKAVAASPLPPMPLAVLAHDIHQDQPELVIEAIRQVVAGVRNPDTWYDMRSCCTE